MNDNYKIGRIKHVGDIDSNIIGFWVRPIGEEELVLVYMEKSLFLKLFGENEEIDIEERLIDYCGDAAIDPDEFSDIIKVI